MCFLILRNFQERYRAPQTVTLVSDSKRKTKLISPCIETLNVLKLSLEQTNPVIYISYINEKVKT